MSADHVIQLIEEIRQATDRSDPADLPGLVTLQERLLALVAAIEPDDAERIGTPAGDAAALIEQIVLREIEDAAAGLADVRTLVDAFTATDDAEATCVDAAPASTADDAAAVPAGRVERDVDPELLGQWIGGSRDQLAALEETTMLLESAAGPAIDELAAEARRIIHTIKGEAGFLSLSEVQTICHDVETAIDEDIEASRGFPIEAVLALGDWLKACLDGLQADAGCVLPTPPAALHAAPGAPDSDDDDLHFDETATPAPADDADAFVADTPSDVDVATINGDETTTPDPTTPTDDDDDEAPLPDGIVELSYDPGMEESVRDFACEAREHLAASEEALLTLENDPSDLELVNTVFRAFHTVKGVAGFMMLGPIVELAHEAETLLDQARSSKIVLEGTCLDLVLKSCDMMSRLIGVLEGESAPDAAEHARLIRVLQCACAGDFDVEVPTASPPANDAPAAAEGADDAPVTAGSVGPGGAAPAGGEGDDAAGQKRNAARRTDQTVKVSTTRMDNLVRMVGELVIAQQMVVQDPRIANIDDQRLQRNLSQVGKIIRDLQGVSMALRMVTVRPAFQKMARLVRDIASRSGKKITFAMEGEDTELDRTVVEEIGDPLVHMVRNACDHGLEPPDERAEAGKNPSGTVTLRAFHQGGSIVIEIEDDGRGLRREKILGKALERGLVTEQQGEEMSDHEVFQLIFAPGFSTADKVTDISGRGVGMDVVRRNIEALRGKVEIRSAPGTGSTFSMRLPLTMAIIDGMVVRVGAERYVLPTLNIEQSFRPTKDDLHTTVRDGEMAMVRERLLPIHRLNRIFDLHEGHDDLEKALLLVIETNDDRCCLMVDEIIGQQQVVIKSLGDGFAKPAGVSGGAILGDGRVALILDVEGLVKEALDRPAPRLAA